MIQLRNLYVLLALLPAFVNGQALKLASKSQGGSFFDAWNVNGSDTDPTQYGNIHYLNDTAALQAQLIGVNKAGNAFLKVDNTTSDPNPGAYSTFGRNSVLIISKDTIDLGTLVVMDAVHIPFGCSVWPAFWTLDSVTHTDEGGEIDIVESVNLMQNNQFSLHAKEGCTLQKNTSMPFTGTQIYEDCNYVFNVTGNRGCGIQETLTQNNLGQAFAQNGGGVYAMYWSNNGIQMWFFPRNNIPQDLSTESPDPSKWPEASASFPANGCNPRTFFNPQNMIININICGAWAANADVYPTTGCMGKCTDMVGTASNYNNAYWEITYVKTFTAQGNTTATTSNSASTTSSSGTNIPTAGPNAASKTLVGAWIASALGVVALFALVM